MSPRVPCIPFARVQAALVRLGFVYMGQTGSHIRMKRRHPDGTMQYLSLPAHGGTVNKGTLAKLLKRNGISLEEFLEAL